VKAANLLVLDGAVASLGLDGNEPWLTVIRDQGEGTALIDRTVLVAGRAAAHDEDQNRWYVPDAATGRAVPFDAPAALADAISSGADLIPGAFVSEWRFPAPDGRNPHEPVEPRRVRSVPEEIVTSHGAHLLARWAVGEPGTVAMLDAATCTWTILIASSPATSSSSMLLRFVGVSREVSIAAER